MATDTTYDQEMEDSQRDKYLTFLVENEEYGIAISYVTEIIGLQKITEIPDLPESLKGVINLRGKNHPGDGHAQPLPPAAPRLRQPHLRGGGQPRGNHRRPDC